MKNPVPLYRALASNFDWWQNCVEKHSDFEDEAEDRIKSLVDKINLRGAELDFDKSKPERLVINFYWTHYNEAGFCIGTTDYKAVITPSLAHGCKIRIVGWNREDIKDMFYETIHSNIDQMVELYG